jgi:hypothetical protein
LGRLKNDWEVAVGVMVGVGRFFGRIYTFLPLCS